MISIADYYTVRNGLGLEYRPTVHYAYHPCDDAVLSLHEFAGKNWRLQSEKRLMMGEITSGMDELGVLLMGHAKGAYWYGSRLTIEETRRVAPYNNATSLQVTAAVLAGMVWAIENPRAGLVEADDMDHVRCMQVARPYSGRGGRRLLRMDAAGRPRRAVRRSPGIRPAPGSSRTSACCSDPTKKDDASNDEKNRPFLRRS